MVSVENWYHDHCRLMVQAKSFDAPIKLLFPRALEEGSKAMPFSMLGLGDIVIPGIFVALILRFDKLYSRSYFKRWVVPGSSKCKVGLLAGPWG